jgi:hypothetical protein
MAKSTDRMTQPQTWIAPSFGWTVEPDVFLVNVPASDPDVVEFISTGVLDVTPAVLQKKLALITLQLLNQEGSLRLQLGTAVWKPAKLRRSPVRAGLGVYAHCHGVFVLPSGTELCVVVGWASALCPNTWITPKLKAEADELFLAHQAEVRKFEEVKDLAEQQHKNSLELLRKNEKYKDVANWFYMEPSWGLRPVLTAETLLHLLPHAAKFRRPKNGDPDRTARVAIAAITASGWSPSRDGVYSGLIPFAGAGIAEGRVSWLPHNGPVSYPGGSMGRAEGTAQLASKA